MTNAEPGLTSAEPRSTRIRAGAEDEAAELAAIHRAAFGRDGEAALAVRLVREARPLVSLVAERDGRAVGHVLFTPVRIEGDRARPPAGALGPVGVLPALQGQGIGSALVRAGLAACPGLGWAACFVLGNPSYYARFGFRLAAPLGLHYASHDFDAAFQVQALAAAGLAGARGWVRYHPAFDAVG